MAITLHMLRFKPKYYSKDKGELNERLSFWRFGHEERREKGLGKK